MRRVRFTAAAFLVLAWCRPIQVPATHLRAADILVEPDCSQPLTFRITVIAYLNTLSATRFGTSSQLYFGDGGVVTIPLTSTTPRPDLGPNIGTASYSVLHTYTTAGTFTVTYHERDRSRGVLNIANSEDVPYVSFVTFTTNPALGCNHYPVLSVPPLDRACKDVAFLHNPGAYDVDGDSLSYELTVPAASPTASAPYTSPIDPRYYTNYALGNEEDTGPPIFRIDPRTGQLTWDAAGMIGEYNIAFKVNEWRRDTLSGFYFKLSTTTRDMQIIVEECLNTRPRISVPSDICVIAGELVEAEVFGTDAENHPVKIEVFSEIVDLPIEQLPATFDPPVATFGPSDPPASLRFHWQTDCMHVRRQPYQVVFKITDDPEDGPKLVSFRVWTIKVVAPPPVWVDPVLDVVKKQVLLTWEPYACEQADKIQIYRKVESFAYLPTTCSPCLPPSLGYHLIHETAGSDTSYLDSNAGNELAGGATYCYRILAYFNAPASTQSLVSVERCFGPIRADAPVITHVTVENTDFTEGSIRVSWRSPLDIDRQQFPEPYQYEIFRANGIAGDTGLVSIAHVSDTSLLDESINTLEAAFNYRIVLYSKPALSIDLVPVDTSEVAASVWLSAKPKLNSIQLMWRDSVPWSNVVQSRPYHLIYRARESDRLEEMILIDSVNVSLEGFAYIDSGQHNLEGIESDQRYAYRVLTRGTYGNPALALQENYSQLVTAYPENDLTPCSQVVRASVITCDEYLGTSNCEQVEFSNSISWSANSVSPCRKDYRQYNVYFASELEGEYELIGITRDTTFTDTGLSSYARCYRITAVDGLGQEGEPGEPACNDNCPYYELPNVFTPNADGLNDVFTAGFNESPEQVYSGSESAIVRCPRFAQAVEFRVYNRWGRPVYSYRSGDARPVTIDWDGLDENGEELPGGLYYYVAEVAFLAIAADRQSSRLHGWIQLVR